MDDMMGMIILFIFEIKLFHEEQEDHITGSQEQVEEQLQSPKLQTLVDQPTDHSQQQQRPIYSQHQKDTSTSKRRQHQE